MNSPSYALRVLRQMLLSREMALFGLLAVLFIGFALFVEGFLDAYNLFERSRYWVIPGLVAIPMTFVIATSGIDLSVGSIVAMCSMALGLLYNDAHWPIAAAALAAVLAGFGAGAFNGVASSYLRIPPLVATLATMALFRGVAMGFSQARSISNFPDAFQWLSQGDLFAIPISGAGKVYVPAPVLALLLATAAGWIILRRTWIGRFTECIGANETAAEFAAVNVRGLKCALYAAMGGVCGIAALFNTALYNTAKADAAMGLELEAIACVVVGGTCVNGGRGSIIGSFLGLLVIGILRYGLEMAGMKSQHVVILVGLLLIATAVSNEWMAGASRRTFRSRKGAHT